MSVSDARARAAYEAYCLATGGRSFEGHNLAAWPDLPVRVRDAWNAAVAAGVRFTPPEDRNTGDPADTEPGKRVARFDDSDDGV